MLCDFTRQRTGSYQHHSTTPSDPLRDERSVRVRAPPLKMLSTNGLRIAKDALPHAKQVTVGLGIERGEERFELTLHLCLAHERRSQAGDHLEQQAIGLGFEQCRWRRGNSRLVA